VSPLRDTTLARVTRAERRLEELRRERQQIDRRYHAACAALAEVFTARPLLPPVPIPLVHLRRGPVLAWGCVGGLFAVFVLLVLAS
jgi:hypothetical protein